jgi:hypothetical protein
MTEKPNQPREKDMPSDAMNNNDRTILNNVQEHEIFGDRDRSDTI